MIDFKALVFFPILLLYIQMSYAQINLQLNRVESFEANDRIGDLSYDKSNKLWVASNKGIFYYDIEGGSATQMIDHPEAVAVAHDGQATFSGFRDNTIYGDNTKILRLEDYFMNVTDITVYDGKIWVGTSNGLFMFDAKTRTFLAELNDRNSQLKSHHIKFVYADQSNVLWIGTKKGIFRVQGDQWSRCYEDEKEMMAITEYLGLVWLMSDNEMWEIDSKSNQWYASSLPKDIYKGEINDIVLDKDGNLFIASNKLVQFNPKSNLVTKISNPPGTGISKFISLEVGKDNILYVGTEKNGLFSLEKVMEKVDEFKILVLLDEAIDCHGNNTGSLMLEVSGGKEPIEFKWNPPYVKGTNPNKLKEGEYTVTVVDALGNKDVRSINIESPNPLAMEILEKKKLKSLEKKDGKCTIAVSGGTEPYDIKWDNGETGKTAKNLNFGMHTIEIVDAQGCKMTEYVEIEKELFIPELNIKTLKVGQTVQINKLYFLADSDIVEESSKPVLDEIRQFMINNPNIVIEIGGHTNSTPLDGYCDELSTLRAKNVANYIGFVGIQAERIKYKGYGKRKPIATNKTVAGRKKNQRVEIKVLEISER